MLRFLLENSEAVSGREMSRLTGLDHKTCHKVLKELSQQGVVRVKSSNHSNLYRLNPKSYLVNKIVSPLFEKERSVLNHFANNNGKKRPDKAASNNFRKGRNHHV